jgi:hypothetical protein
MGAIEDAILDLADEISRDMLHAADIDELWGHVQHVLGLYHARVHVETALGLDCSVSEYIASEAEAAFRDLPKFGGKDPEDKDGVWSWDEKWAIVGYDWKDAALVRRDGLDAHGQVF